MTRPQHPRSRSRRAGGERPDVWTDYLSRFHTEHAAITERVLTDARHPTLGNPYQWLRAGVSGDPARVLDLACGSAPMQPLFPGADYLGIDTSEAELHEARQRGRPTVVLADARSVPVASGSCDAVICSMAIMLLRPVEAAVAEAARVLRPGGTLAAIRPTILPLSAKDLRVVVPLVLGLRHLPEFPQHFTGRSLTRLITAAGLEVTGIEGVRFAHPLDDPADARLAVEALYLPHVSQTRLEAAADRLAAIAAPGREVPVSIQRIIARRPTPTPAESPQQVGSSPSFRSI